MGGAFNCYKMFGDKNENDDNITEKQIEDLKILGEIICNVILKELENVSYEK